MRCVCNMFNVELHQIRKGLRRTVMDELACAMKDRGCEQKFVKGFEAQNFTAAAIFCRCE